jgi:hypothetical protein
LRKLLSSKEDKSFVELSDIGKKKSRIIKFHKVMYAELVLSIDVKTSNCKIDFIIVDGVIKSKDYPESNAINA